MNAVTFPLEDLSRALDLLELVDHRFAEAEALFGAVIHETARDPNRRSHILAQTGADLMDRALGDLAEPLEQMRQLVRASIERGGA